MKAWRKATVMLIRAIAHRYVCLPLTSYVVYAQ